MTNYFLTTTFDSSKIIFLFHLSVHLILVYVLYSFWARETCCCSETWNIWVQFTSPTWNTIMFLRLGGLEKKTCCWRWVKCNCAVIAAVQVRRKAVISGTEDVSKKTFLLTAFHSTSTPLPHRLIPELFSSVRYCCIIRSVWLHRDTLAASIDTPPKGTLIPHI